MTYANHVFLDKCQELGQRLVVLAQLKRTRITSLIGVNNVLLGHTMIKLDKICVKHAVQGSILEWECQNALYVHQGYGLSIINHALRVSSTSTPMCRLTPVHNVVPVQFPRKEV